MFFAANQWSISNAKRRMIGSGIPINHDKAPPPKPMTASIVSCIVQLWELGCYEISLGDTIGVGTPAKARK
jgi:hypothetical protein